MLGDGGMTVTGASPSLRTPHTGQQPGNVAKKRGAHRSVTDQDALYVLRAGHNPPVYRPIVVIRRLSGSMN